MDNNIVVELVAVVICANVLFVCLRNKPIRFVEAITGSLIWFGISILTYYKRSREAGGPLWVMASVVAWLYLIEYAIGTCAQSARALRARRRDEAEQDRP